MNTLATVGNNLGLVHNAKRGEWRGSCPACSYNGTFAISTKGERLVWWCSNCADGGREALTAVVCEVMGGALAPSPSERHTEADKAEQARQRRAWAEDLWIRAMPAAGTLAETYLTLRGLASFASSAALRFLPSHKHTESGSYHPAMLAKVTAPDGSFAALHRTYLNRRGTGKASVSPPKKTIGNIEGGAIRLQEPGDALVIGEGIETAASAGVLTGLPAWAAVAAGNLPRVVLPPTVRRVVIAADHDPPGKRFAKEAARRWAREGREVSIKLPNQEHEDFNDILLREHRQHG